MDYTTWTSASAQEGKDLLSEDHPLLTSLYRALQALPDGRRGQGKRYDLALLICLLLLAKLAGQTSLSGATDWYAIVGSPLGPALAYAAPACLVR